MDQSAVRSGRGKPEMDQFWKEFESRRARWGWLEAERMVFMGTALTDTKKMEET